MRHYSFSFRAKKTKCSIVLASLIVIDCSAFYRVVGVVTSCDNGKPINGATVELSYEDQIGKEYGKAETDLEGYFVVALNDPPGDYESDLKVSADGYKTKKVKARHTVDVNKMADICLESRNTK